MRLLDRFVSLFFSSSDETICVEILDGDLGNFADI